MITDVTKLHLPTDILTSRYNHIIISLPRYLSQRKQTWILLIWLLNPVLNPVPELSSLSLDLMSLNELKSGATHCIQNNNTRHLIEGVKLKCNYEKNSPVQVFLLFGAIRHINRFQTMEDILDLKERWAKQYWTVQTSFPLLQKLSKGKWSYRIVWEKNGYGSFTCFHPFNPASTRTTHLTGEEINCVNINREKDWTRRPSGCRKLSLSLFSLQSL